MLFIRFSISTAYNICGVVGVLQLQEKIYLRQLVSGNISGRLLDCLKLWTRYHNVFVSWLELTVNI